MGRLAGKVALVTGASSGIGEGIARLFASEGAQVSLAANTPQTLQSVAHSIIANGGDAFAVETDVSQTEDLRRMVETTIERFGKLDILVNNAGIGHFWRKLGQEGMEEAYDKLMDTNLKSAWMGTHFAVPYLKQSGAGSIIHISSVHALASSTNQSVYAATKGAMIAGTHAMALELAPYNIRVNCISPGCIYLDEPGDHIKEQYSAEIYAEYQERFAAREAHARILQQAIPVAGKPIDIAYCAVYLASDEARFVTGTNFVIDGGATATLANPLRVSQNALETKQLRQEIHDWLEQVNTRIGSEEK